MDTLIMTFGHGSVGCLKTVVPKSAGWEKWACFPARQLPKNTARFHATRPNKCYLNTSDLD